MQFGEGPKRRQVRALYLQDLLQKLDGPMFIFLMIQRDVDHSEQQRHLPVGALGRLDFLAVHVDQRITLPRRRVDTAYPRSAGR